MATRTMGADHATTIDGCRPALSQLIALAYDTLRNVAVALLRREPHCQGYEPDDLIDDAYMRVARRRCVDDEHATALMTRVMQRILVEHGRSRCAAKRGGRAQRVPLDETGVAAPSPMDSMAFQDALRRLGAERPRSLRVVELRCLGGKTIAETAAILGVSPRTVDVEWHAARAWLRRQLQN